MAACRVFISADIEGVAGVVTSQQTLDTARQYHEGRELMTEEVNAAVAGAFDGGATDVVVCDSHAAMQNLLPARLDERAVLVRGAMRDSLQMEGMDASFHAVFVTGDEATIAQTRESLPKAVMVSVKTSHGRGVAASLHPREACRRIRTAAAEAVRIRDQIPPFRLPGPLVMEIAYNRTDMAQTALVPGVARIAPRTVRVEGDPDTIFRLQELLVYRLRYEL